MLNYFYVGAYRGLENLELNDLKKVNIFVGPNNCGKTSILETIILSSLFDNVELLMDSLVSRYHGFSIELLESLFPIDRPPIICLKSKWNGEARMLHTHLEFKRDSLVANDASDGFRNLFRLLFQYSYGEQEEIVDKYEIRFEEVDSGKYELGMAKPRYKTLQMNTVPCKFISFSRFDRSNKFLKDLDNILDSNLRQQLIEILQIFDEHITNFELIGANRVIKLFRNNSERPLTLYDYGNGMYKAFYIGMSALLSRDGILLVDEVEAGIHNKALQDFMTKLLQVCDRNNVQLFMTTHSLEAIDVLLDDCKDNLDDTAIYHISNETHRTIAKRYSGEKLMSLRNEIGFDVR